MKNAYYIKGQTVYIKLRQRNKLCSTVKIDLEDLPRVAKYSRWSILRGRSGGKYCGTKLHKIHSYILLHRMLMQPKATELVKFLNGNGFDCRKNNLFITDQHGVASFKRYSRKLIAGSTGETWIYRSEEGSFYIRCQFYGKIIYKGTYRTIREAIKRRNTLREELMDKLLEMKQLQDAERLVDERH